MFSFIITLCRPVSKHRVESILLPPQRQCLQDCVGTIQQNGIPQIRIQQNASFYRDGNVKPSGGVHREGRIRDSLLKENGTSIHISRICHEKNQKSIPPFLSTSHRDFTSLSSRPTDDPSSSPFFPSRAVAGCSSREFSERIEAVVASPIRPLSINEILTLHTRPLLHSSGDESAKSTTAEYGATSATECATETSSLNRSDVTETSSTVNAAESSATESNAEKSSVPRSSAVDFNCSIAGNSPRSDSAAAQQALHEVLLLRSATWARREIPLRLAHRLHDFSRLPFVVVSNEHVFEVYKLYCEAFQVLIDFGDIKSVEDEARFNQHLKDIVSAHANVVALMQRGISNLTQSHTDISLNSFLDRLFGTRIGNRILAETHLALHDNPQWFDAAGGLVNPTLGVIQKHCKPASVIRDVAAKVQQVAMYTYGCAPEVCLGGELDINFPYIPEHLRFICFEIIKNSIRATIEHHINRMKSSQLPPVTVGIYKGPTQVVIKVTDQGGGLPEELHDVIWQYGFSTVPRRYEEKQPDPKQMAGYGFGLPLSRLYSRYFGGNLDIKFMAGYGSDTYIFLPRLGNQRESEEMLNNSLYQTYTNKKSQHP